MIRMFVLLIGLAGCGGSSVSSGGGAVMVDFDTLQDAVSSTGITPFAAIPDSGTHRYDGQMALNLPLGTTPHATYLGRFDLRLSFADASVASAGTVKAFTAVNENTLGGELVFSGGTLVPNADPNRDFVMFADLGGKLTNGATTYDLDAQVAADIYGLTADGVAGQVFSGVIRQGDDIDIFDGSFAGKKVP